MVSTHPQPSKFSSSFNNPLVIVPKAPIWISLIVTFMFYSFFNSARVAKSAILQVISFLLITIRSGLLAEIRWSVCMSKSHRSLCVSFSRKVAGLYICHLFIWPNWYFFLISQWIPLLTHSCLVLYSFSVNLLHSLIMWLIVSSLSPHIPHLLFCFVISIITLIWLVLTALFCAAIRRYSVSLLRFPVLSHVHAFS